MSIQGWFPLGLTGLSRVFSSATIRKHQFFSTQPSLWSSSHILYLTVGNEGLLMWNRHNNSLSFDSREQEHPWVYSQGGRQEASLLLGLLSALRFAVVPRQGITWTWCLSRVSPPSEACTFRPLAEHPWQFISDTLWCGASVLPWAPAVLSQQDGSIWGKLSACRLPMRGLGDCSDLNCSRHP